MRPLRRIFHENIENESVTLNQEESHHLLKVLRLSTGDKVEIFDGMGASRPARVGETRKKSAEIVFAGPKEVQPAPEPLVTLAVAPPKGQRMDTLVQMAQEIGLDELVPIITDNSARNEFSDNKFARWKRVAIAAAKQSGNNRVIRFAQAMDFDALVADFGKWDLRIACHVGATGTNLRDCINATAKPSNVLACVGPEGGFTNMEITAAREAGFSVAGFPTATLRVETAAVFALSALRALLGVNAL